MTQVQILSGIYGQSTPDLINSYPVNLVPIVEDSGISKGYLRTAPGARQVATSMGADRGATLWNGACYRVSGASLITAAASGAVVTIGTVGGPGPVSFARSFDRLAITSGDQLYYLKDGALILVTDTDLGPALDVIWLDGYFMTTDGTSLVVTELNDPTAVDPLKYGSAEADPDPIVGLISVRGEAYAIGRYSIEVFTNLGTTGFPFSRNRGAQIQKGAVGTRAKCRFAETFAFVGGGYGEGPAVWLAGQGEAVKLSARAVDVALAGLSDAELLAVELESRQSAGRNELFVHLPTITYAYSLTASQALETAVWYRLASGPAGSTAYRPRHAVLVDGDWIVGDVSGAGIAVLDDTRADHFGEPVGWQFDVPLIYNKGGGVIHEFELIGQFGRAKVGSDPVCFLSMTEDALTWGQERVARLGKAGERDQRIAWRRLGAFRNWRGMRIRGVGSDPVSFNRGEARLEQLGAN